MIYSLRRAADHGFLKRNFKTAARDALLIFFIQNKILFIRALLQLFFYVSTVNSVLLIINFIVYSEYLKYYIQCSVGRRYHVTYLQKKKTLIKLLLLEEIDDEELLIKFMFKINQNFHDMFQTRKSEGFFQCFN
jgi:hypothetical protein